MASEYRASTEALRDVIAERVAQDAKWGEQNHDPYKWLAILSEEVGEVAEAMLKGSRGNYRDEMVQVAAVAVAAVECLDRGKQEVDRGK